MRQISTHPPKRETPIVIAIRAANWPAWVPRPANPQQPVEAPQPQVEDAATSQHERVSMIRLIGQRLRESREMAGFSQQDAAIHLGYKNSSKLAKVENASDTFSVPIALIIKAAGLYEVSTDYLLGINEDWEVAPQERHQRQIGRWLFDSWQVARERDLAAMSALGKKIAFVAGGISNLSEKAENVQFAFEKLRSLNSNYDELIAGAKLQATVDALVETGRQARLALKRLHIELAGERVGATGGSHGQA